MRDKRPVDELSIEELERILAIKKREERQKRLKKMERDGRVMVNETAPEAKSVPAQTVAERANPFAPPTPTRMQDTAPTAASVDLTAASPARLNGSENGDGLYFDDDTAEGFLPAEQKAGKKGGKKAVNALLLLVEVAAVVGLVLLGYELINAIGVLERETAAAVEIADAQRRAGIPTPEPTPQLSLEQIVLPGGHTPPTAPGGAQFNYSEIPSHLRPVVQQELAQPVIHRPAPKDETAVALTIPKLNVSQTIVQGVDWEALRLGIGQLTNGVTPDAESGNLVFAAHNDIYGEYFRHLDQLEPGDQFQVQTQSGSVFTYAVTGSEIVAPTAVHVMDYRGGATATLISCYPYQVNSQRIVIYAERVA